eukprot:755023-Hanusia_phi.AAC.1
MDDRLGPDRSHRRPAPPAAADSRRPGGSVTGPGQRLGRLGLPAPGSDSECLVLLADRTVPVEKQLRWMTPCDLSASQPG